MAQTLQDFWESYTGVRPSHIWVVAGQQAIAVLLEEVLTPAERQMINTEAGQLIIQKFEVLILEQARPRL